MSHGELRQLRVLFATDGSEHAQTAAAWLVAFPLPAGARVLILAVQDLPPSPLDIPTVRDFERALMDEARRAAGVAAAVLRARFSTIEVQVAAGDPREVIVRTAADWDADLIVVGARGLGALASALLGSVSLAVARHAPCPVLIVRPAARPLQSVAIGFDGSTGARRAVRFVARLALPSEVRVRLVGVAEPARAPEGVAALAEAAERITAARRSALEAAMGRAAAPLDGPQVGHELAVGAPAETLAHLDADLIVLGARGLGPLRRLVLGSVSEQVLRHARCPVLIVRGSLMDRLARRRRRRTDVSVSA